MIAICSKQISMILVAYSGPELLIPVDILRIPALGDRNTLPAEHLPARNCLSDSAFFLKFLPILLAW